MSPCSILGELAGRTVPERGRGRAEFESREEGLCCHDSVPLRAREVVVGGVGRSRGHCGGSMDIVPISGGEIAESVASRTGLDAAGFVGVKG